MTLSEIENILEELSSRHKNFNSDLLTILLQSAGWEEKNIKEAAALFKQRAAKSEAVRGVSGNAILAPESAQFTGNQGAANSKDITFYQQDGTEEDELNSVADTPPLIKEQKNEQKIEDKGSDIFTKLQEILSPITILSPLQEKIATPGIAPVSKKEEVLPLFVAKEQEKERYVASQVKDPPLANSIHVGSVTILQTSPATLPAVSLLRKEMNLVSDSPTSLTAVKSEPERKLIKKISQIPEDLPLLPFESSSHVWSFAHYKNMFHGEVKEEKSSESTKVEPAKEESVKPSSFIPNKENNPYVAKENDIDIEKVPMTRGDESLVFLAGIMLLVIILILGYMYSHGRL